MGSLSVETEISRKIKEKWFVKGARSHEERVYVICFGFLFNIFQIFVMFHLVQNPV